MPSSPQLLADHSLLLALPAFAPAFVVVGVVVWVAMRDRRNGDDEDDDDAPGDGVHTPSSDHPDDHPPAADQDGRP